MIARVDDRAREPAQEFLIDVGDQIPEVIERNHYAPDRLPDELRFIDPRRHELTGRIAQIRRTGSAPAANSAAMVQRYRARGTLRSGDRWRAVPVHAAPAGECSPSRCAR